MVASIVTIALFALVVYFIMKCIDNAQDGTKVKAWLYGILAAVGMGVVIWLGIIGYIPKWIMSLIQILYIFS